MRVMGRGIALALALAATTGANLGMDPFGGQRALAAQELAARTGGEEQGDKFCAITAGVTVGCLLSGQMWCALGGAVVWMVACEQGG